MAKNNTKLWISIGAGVLLVGGGLYYFLKKKKDKENIPSPEDDKPESDGWSWGNSPSIELFNKSGVSNSLGSGSSKYSLDLSKKPDFLGLEKRKADFPNIWGPPPKFFSKKSMAFDGEFNDFNANGEKKENKNIQRIATKKGISIEEAKSFFYARKLAREKGLKLPYHKWRKSLKK
jgi:LPXTG-motif cell wall-anchored protein